MVTNRLLYIQVGAIYYTTQKGQEQTEMTVYAVKMINGNETKWENMDSHYLKTLVSKMIEKQMSISVEFHDGEFNGHPVVILKI